MAQGKVEVMNLCGKLHALVKGGRRYSFPFNKNDIPRNGVYVLFEKGESGHEGDRIVRVGTHTGDNQLRSRLTQHFIKENKDRSIFRKNIGRALLNKDGNPFLEQWEYDLTSREGREKHGSFVDGSKLRDVENAVTKYIQRSFSFVILEVMSKNDRLKLESRLVSTVSLCPACQPSTAWLGHRSPKLKIRESGLWQVNELYKEPMTGSDLDLVAGTLLR